MSSELEFKPSGSMTIGAELELQFLDGNTLDLADGILPLLELCPASEYITPEIVQNTVEIVSPICNGIDELEARLSTAVANLNASCRKLGMRLCGAGTHPFSQRLSLVTPLPRYVRMQQQAGHLARTQITFATHVHLGMASGDEAMRVMRGLKPFLPLLIALSASSPFWRGHDTGYVAYRHRILAATRSYGVPPSFGSWDEFCHFLTSTRRAGLFESIDDIHWDLRPRPRIGTLEIRVMDAQPSVHEAANLASLLRVLAHYLKAHPTGSLPPGLPQPLQWWFEKENHFHASRLGMQGNCVADAQGVTRGLAELWEGVADTLQPLAAELGEADRLEALRRSVAEGLSHARQRRVYEQTGSLQAVVGALVEELEAHLPSGEACASI
jgi:glutamate---cysteine ligase / carboxylate-amine ligase